MNDEHLNTLKSAEEALAAIQNFEAASIVRAQKLGSAFDFSSAEDSARSTVDYFRQIPVSGLRLLPTSSLHSLQSISTSTLQLFQQCLDFDPTSANASNTRDSIVSSINSHPSTAFNALSPLVSYLGSQNIGAQSTFDKISNDLIRAQAEINELVEAAKAARAETSTVLDSARTAAGSVGVSKEASHFSTAAASHETAASNWKKATIGSAIILLLYSVGTAFLHKWSWFMPTTNIGLTQFIVSKILIFGILGYLLTLSAKNYMNHKHNEIVNKHRQNALLTYETMVNAGQTPDARNIVLQLAAASIYQLHDTGYVKPSESSGASNIVEIMPKTSIPLNPSGS